MCSSKQAPAAAAPAPLPVAPAAPVPLPAETVRPAVAETATESANDKKLKRSGRSKLTIPAAGVSSTTGMSGLNIPQ